MTDSRVVPRALIGRGDLLRILKALGPQALAEAAAALGYEQRHSQPSVEAPAEPVSPLPHRRVEVPEPVPPPAPDFKARYWALAQREPRPATAIEAPAWYNNAQPLQGDRVEDWRAPPWQPLVPWSRLGPWLRRRLGDTRPSREPDIAKVTAGIAAGRPLPRIPQRERWGWASRICVLLDHSSHLWPYRDDINDVWRRLRHLRGMAHADVRLLVGAPGAHLRVRSVGHAGWEDRAWQHPPPGVPLLVLGDLGLLAPSPAARTGWLRFGQALQAAGVSAAALCPVPANRVPDSLARCFDIHEWDRAARLALPVRPGAESRGNETAAIEALLARLTPTLRVQAPLLRALRSGLRAHAALEADILRHAEVLSDGANLCLAGDASSEGRRRTFRALPSTEQRRIAELIRAHHGHTPSLHLTEWGLIEHYLRDQAADALRLVLSDAEREAVRAFRCGLVRLCRDGGKGFLMDYWLPDTLSRQGEGLLHSQAPLHALWAISQRATLHRDGHLDLPAWLPPEAALSFFLDAADLPPRACHLVQVGDRLRLEAAPKASLIGAVLADCRLQGDQVRIDLAGTTAPVSQMLRAADLPADLGHLGPACNSVLLDLGAERLRLETISRPSWASAMGRDASGLWAEITWLGTCYRQYRAEEVLGIPARWLGDGPVGFDEYGLRADFTITTQHGTAAQRLRWIEPGSFWMGSPEDEADRFDDEGPRHRVTLTRGYWLADSACTQALWQAVMGKNPARFQDDPQRPVEQVSWEDVDEFLRQLRQLLPGCAATLPTDAEWEYACRAGSDTVFSFGAKIDAERVNYSGKRNGTVAVKSLPPNAWGLYEMHGNVWEWCADGKRKYTAETQQDPSGQGPEDKRAHRAVRGGSWIYGARGARSAYRHAYVPGDRFGDLGFRLALRSIEPDPGRPGGTVGVSPRDEAGVASAERSPKKKRLR